MARYLLDTNHASSLLASRDPLAGWLLEAEARGDQVALSTTVLGELYYAAHASARQDANPRLIERLLAHVTLFLFDEAAAAEFGRIRAEQRAKGRPIPPTDAQIAAVARLHDLIVLTGDRHFTYVDRLRVENWLATSS